MVTPSPLAMYLAAHPYLLVLLEVAAPVVLALVVFALCRRGSRATRRAVALAALAPTLAALWLIVPLRWLSPYDLLLPAALFSALTAALALPPGRGGPTPRPTLALSAALLVVGALGLEWMARRHPERMVRVTSIRDTPVVFSDAMREAGFIALFPRPPSPYNPFPPGLRRPGHEARLPGVRRVVHIGDSVVASADVPPGTTFEELLARRSGAEHVNLGVSSVGTDFELQVARTWLPRLAPDEVVLHIYPRNDLDELDRTFLYCDDGPLLGPSAQGLPLRCPTPRFRLTRRRLLAQGPSPLALRLAASHSALAHRMLGGFERAIRAWAPDVYRHDRARAWERLRAVLAALRDEAARRRIPLRVVVIPHRPGEPPEAREERETAEEAEERELDQRTVAVAQALGLAPAVPLEAFTAAVRARPGARWFVGRSPHFDVDGQREYADFLARSFGWSEAAGSSVPPEARTDAERDAVDAHLQHP